MAFKVFNSIRRNSSLDESSLSKLLVRLDEFRKSPNYATAAGSSLDVYADDRSMLSLEGSLIGLIEHALLTTFKILPTNVRKWYIDMGLSRSDQLNVNTYVTKYISPKLIALDFADIQTAITSGAFGSKEADLSDETEVHEDITISVNEKTKTIIINYIKDDSQLDLEIVVNDNYPLSAVTVECRRFMGISQKKLNLWVLQMLSYLNNKNGALLDCVNLVKENLKKEFSGLDPCVICYSVINVDDYTTPKLNCKTCKNKFHHKCLATWFRTSHKNECPLCKQPIHA